MSKCEVCQKPSAHRCPTCRELNLPDAHYCSKECFSAAWKTHKRKHRNIKQQQQRSSPNNAHNNRPGEKPTPIIGAVKKREKDHDHDIDDDDIVEDVDDFDAKSVLSRVDHLVKQLREDEALANYLLSESQEAVRSNLYSTIDQVRDILSKSSSSQTSGSSLLTNMQAMDKLSLALAHAADSFLSIDLPEDALELHKEALSLRRFIITSTTTTTTTSSPATSGSSKSADQDLLFACLMSVGKVLVDDLQRFEEALPYLQEGALLKRELARGRDSGIFAETLILWGRALIASGKIQDGMMIELSALDMCRRLYQQEEGKQQQTDHPRLVLCLCYRANDLAAMSKHEEAIQLFREALEIQRRIVSSRRQQKKNIVNKNNTSSTTSGKEEEKSDAEKALEAILSEGSNNNTGGEEEEEDETKKEETDQKQHQLSSSSSEETAAADPVIAKILLDLGASLFAAASASSSSSSSSTSSFFSYNTDEQQKEKQKEEALLCQQEGLAMCRTLYHGTDHHDLVCALYTVAATIAKVGAGSVSQLQQSLALSQEALEMLLRLTNVRVTVDGGVGGGGEQDDQDPTKTNNSNKSEQQPAEKSKSFLPDGREKQDMIKMGKLLCEMGVVESRLCRYGQGLEHAQRGFQMLQRVFVIFENQQQEEDEHHHHRDGCHHCCGGGHSCHGGDDDDDAHDNEDNDGNIDDADDVRRKDKQTEHHQRIKQEKMKKESRAVVVKKVVDHAELCNGMEALATCLEFDGQYSLAMAMKNEAGEMRKRLRVVG